MSVVEKAEERWGGWVWWSAETGGVGDGEGERGRGPVRTICSWADQPMKKYILTEYTFGGSVGIDPCAVCIDKWCRHDMQTIKF